MRILRTFFVIMTASSAYLAGLALSPSGVLAEPGGGENAVNENADGGARVTVNNFIRAEMDTQI